jgi:hypothetical protein
VLETVQAAGEGELGGWLAAGLDITIVHSDGRRTRKPGLIGRHLVADQGGAQLGVDAEFSPDLLHQSQRSPIVRASLDIQHLNQRAPCWALLGDRRHVGLPPPRDLRMGFGQRRRDAAAGGDMVSVAFQQPIGQLEDVGHALVGEAVVHHPMFASGLYEPAPAEAGQVVGDLGLGQAEPASQFPGRQLPLGAEQRQDAQPGRVAEGAEVLGHQVLSGGCLGEAERCKL